MSISVVIVDDHALVRQGLRRYLEMAKDVTVAGEASTGREALELLDALGGADIVLLDVRMPEMDGLEAARRIRLRHPEVRVIMLTAYDERQFVVEAVRAGARGYVLKAADAEHLIEAIRLVADGNIIIDPHMAAELAAELSRGNEAEGSPEALTAQELEILQLLAFGSTRAEIAKQMHVSPGAMKEHLGRIYAKLGTSDRTVAVAEALRRKLIE